MISQDPSLALLEAAQASVAARLRMFSYFAQINIVSEALGSIADAIEKAVGTLSTQYASGVMIMLMTPWANDTRGSVPAIVLDPLYLDVQVIENVLLNRTAQGSRKSADELAINAYRCLKGWRAEPLDSVLAGVPNQTLMTVPDDTFYIKSVRLQSKLALPLLRLPGEASFVNETMPQQ